MKSIFILASIVSAILLAGHVGIAQEPQKLKIDDVWSIALSKDGKVIAGGAGWWDQAGEVGVWDLPSQKPLRRFAEARGIASVALTSDGKLLATGSWTGHVRVYDWAASKEVADFEVAGVARVAISPDDKLLATATEQKTVQLWDLQARKPICDLDGDMVRFHCVMFSPDGKQVLASGGEWKPGGISHVAIWDVQSRKQVMKLVGHDNSVVCMTYSPDGNTIATGSIDRSIMLWDAKTGNHLKTLNGHTHWVETLLFSADGKTLISGSHDRTIRFWDLDKGVEKAGRITIAGSVRVLQFSADGKSLLVGGGPKVLKIYDLATHEETAALWNGDVPFNVPAENPRVVELPKPAMEELPVAVPIPAKNVGRGWLALGVLMTLGLLMLAGVALAMRFLIFQRNG